MKGIYQSSYEDPSGDVHYMATTQFEAAGARKTFPCFDEPEYKAIFDMTIASKYEEYSATWNLPEASREPHPDKEQFKEDLYLDIMSETIFSKGGESFQNALKNSYPT